MKKRNLFVLGALALGLGFSVRVFSEDANYAQMVKAEGVSGEVKLYFGDNLWSKDACNVSVYFYNETDYSPKKEGWGTYVSVSQGQFEADVSYNFDWTPNKMIAVRYDANFSQSSWEGNRWGDGGSKWGQAPSDGGYNLADHISITDWNYGDTEYPYVVSSETSWGSKLDLNGVKLNGEKHFEYFSDSVSFVENEEFKIFTHGDYCNGYSLADVVQGYFTRENEGANIKCVVSGTYSLYFDSINKSVHITDPALAAADKFAQDFLGANCDASRSNWGDLADEFNALSPEAQALLVDEEHVSHDANIEGYIKRAVQRYDYVLERYHINSANTDELGYEDFMGRATKINLSPRMNPISIFAEGESSNAIVATLIIVSLLATGGALLFLRKRKSNYLGR